MSETPKTPHEPLSAYYASEKEKPNYLKQLFDTSADQYDRILKYGFFGTGSAYRKRALARAGLQPGMRLLDVACGTGVVMEQAAKTVPLERIVGLDPSVGMLEAARRKFPEATFREGRAEKIPGEDNAFDFVSMGYALRHVETLDAAFREYFRVLKPGGKVLILEISRPHSRTGYLAVKLYMKYFLPALTLVLSRDRRAYGMMRYFWDSIEACASREDILRALERSGFQECRNDSELGIFSAFSGVKPRE